MNATQIEKIKEQLVPLIGKRIRMKAPNGWFSAVLIDVSDDGPMFDTSSFREEPTEQ